MRVLLKISGEALKGRENSGVDAAALHSVCLKIQDLQNSGVEVGIVLGGGNLFRGIAGSASLKIERSAADHVGMLATMMNGLLLSQGLQACGAKAAVMSAIACPQIVDSFHFEKARARLKEGYIVIFVGGTGHPYFTTDTAAALRASEINADFFWKATMHVDGVYDKDPLKNKNANRYSNISYEDFLKEKLGILDLTAVTLCMTNKIPIRVFNFNQGSLLDDSLGTVIR